MKLKTVIAKGRSAKTAKRVKSLELTTATGAEQIRLGHFLRCIAKGGVILFDIPGEEPQSWKLKTVRNHP